jgi:hydroxymethylglutaryl-CoA synthase
MNIGIDSIAFSTSNYYLSLKVLAEKRNIDYNKYYQGIGQTKMSVFPPNEDIVTIAADAAQKAVSYVDNKNDIDMLIFATESSFDLSKSAGIYVHNFLGLKDDCRVFDIKQACYSATAALQIAKSYINDNPKSKVLVIGSDIIKYLPGTSGEPTQGGGAAAFVVSQNPRILEIEPYSGIHTVDVMDFWRPVKLDEALFDGKLSAYNYLKSLDICTKKYFGKSGLEADSVNHVCFHAPFGKMAIKANNQSFKSKTIDETLVYNSVIGNSCSASIFISFISLMDNFNSDLTGSRIGFFSYGSGSVAEFFSGIISKNYKKMLRTQENKIMLDNRIPMSFAEYELICGCEFQNFSTYKNIGSMTLRSIDNFQRIYGIVI